MRAAPIARRRSSQVGRLQRRRAAPSARSYLEEAHGEAGFWDRLSALSRPALFLWGERDQLVPSRFAPHVEAVLPGARSIVLDDCGHVPQFEHPAVTHRLVRDFLGRPG